MAGLVPFNKRKDNLRTTGFDDFYNMLDNFFEDTWAPFRGLQCDTFKLDVEEKENEYEILAELPGVKKDEIKLDMDNNRLNIAIERTQSVDEENKNYIHKERRTCSMQRSVYLRDTNSDKIKAKLDDGILKITVPKDKAKASSKSINIE